MSVVTRMAPSPTGEFHIGALRTLLFNYAQARGNEGKFILRIEDTDRNRFVEGAIERFKEVITDYGMDWDEYYVQSDRLEIYKEYAQKLIESGHAYPCFCTSERLEKLREDQRAKGMPRTFYDKHCAKLSPEEVAQKIEAGEDYVVRLKVPENEEITFTDEILGQININSSEIDDTVLLKSDGYPTYHLAVVVDDHLMGVTHVMRGNEWIPSVPKHVLLYKYFGWELPKFAHLPNLKEKGQNKKLSKRFGDVNAADFLKKGYLPEAIINFLMFLGWNPGTEKEFYTLDEFISDFSIDRIQKTDLVAFDREKLLWFNSKYISDLSASELLEVLVSWSARHEIDVPVLSVSKEKLLSIISAVKERMRTLEEINELTAYFIASPILEIEVLRKYGKERTPEILELLLGVFDSSEGWDTEKLEEECKIILGEKNFSPKEFFMTLRVAITGVEKSPPIFEVLNILGKDETINRIKNAINSI